MELANLYRYDAQRTMRIMQGVVADASILKRRAGGSSKGRKLRDPYVHHMFSWRPGEHPTMEEKLAAVSEGLKEVGLDDRIAIAVAHNDTDHGSNGGRSARRSRPPSPRR